MKNSAIGILTGLLLLLPAQSGFSRGEISDNRARLALAGALLKTPGGRSDAAAQLDILSAQEPEDPRLLAEMADLRISMGHYREGNSLYRRLITLPGADKRTLEEKLADRSMLWGDYHGAEKVWRERLRRNPDDRKASLRLAEALIGADRLEEAQAVCAGLWHRPERDPEAGLKLAEILMLQKKFSEAGEQARRAGKFPENEKPAGILLGRALQSLGELEAAEEVFYRLARGEEADAGDWVRLGAVQLKRGRGKRAADSFKTALKKDPEHIEAAFRLAGRRSAGEGPFLSKVLNRETEPERLKVWAELYTAEGFRENALACYERALVIDPDYFPAAEGRAFILAISGRHARSAELYRELLEDFPGSRKPAVGLARTLAWGRKYEESLRTYDRLIEKHPDDLILQREAARTALWGKKFDEAMDRYGRILSPGAAEQLFRALLPLSEHFGPRAAAALDELETLKEKKPGACGFKDWLEMEKEGALPDPAVRIIRGLSGRYKIQRAVALEREYKQLQMRRRFARAYGEVSRLIDLTPGDQEAVFDRAQIACVLGLAGPAKKDYERLLLLDPAHSIASEALRLARLDAGAALSAGGTYWRENGRDGLSDLRRRTAGAGLEAPVVGETRAFLNFRRIFESPGGFPGRINSKSYTLGLGGALNPYFRGGASLTEKRYDGNRFKDSRGGSAYIWANARDIVRLGAGFERSDELYNRFGFEQDVKSDSVWLKLESDLTRRWNAGAEFRRADYNDGNHGLLSRIAAGYEFTDHPRIFKMELAGEYRDTRLHSRLVFDSEDRLIDIIHPYWTPQDYLGVFLTFEWRHDISGPHQYCGNRRHFYDLKAVVGTDSESNPGIRLEAQWQYRFTDRWSAALEGYAHNSRDWDASGARFALSRRF